MASHEDREENRDRITCHAGSIARNSPKAVALHRLDGYDSLKLSELEEKAVDWHAATLNLAHELPSLAPCPSPFSHPPFFAPLFRTP